MNPIKNDTKVVIYKDGKQEELSVLDFFAMLEELRKREKKNG